jgi:hypothetical protein
VESKGELSKRVKPDGFKDGPAFKCRSIKMFDRRFHFYQITNFQKKLTNQIKEQREDFKWIYIGTNISIENNLKNELGDSNRYLFSKELNEISKQYRQEFISQIGEISCENSQLDWYSTVVSYKSPLSTDLFENFCIERLFYKWSQRTYGPNIVFIEDKFLYLDLIKHYSKSSWFNFLKEKLYMSELLFKSKLRTLRWIFVKLLKVNYQRKKYLKSIHKILNDKYDFGIFTWVEDNSFENNVFVGKYLKKLYPIIHEMKKNNIIITHSKLSDKLVELGIENKILPLSILETKSDYLTSAYLMFRQRIRINKQNKIFKQLRYSLKKNLIANSTTSLDFFLFYKVSQTVLKNIDLSTNKIIYPFENQPYEKMLILSSKKLKMEYRFIGYQHASIPDNYLNYFNSSKEKNKIPTPEIIVANGNLNKIILNQSNFKSRVINGGSLRFASQLRLKSPNLKSENTMDKCLVLLNYNTRQTVQVLAALKKADHSISFLIKLHPDQDVEEIRSYLISIPNNFIFVYDKIPILLKQVNMIIHNGGTAIFECIGYGIPFVNYIDNSLSLDALNAAFPDQMNITEVDLTNIKEVFKKQKICPNINLFEDVNMKIGKKF